MATLREIRRRIDSVKSTQQITKAMKMVAAAKLRKAQQQLASARPFYDELAEIVGRIAVLKSGHNHPYFTQRKTNHDCYVLITADRGLCGSFNSNLIRTATKQLQAEGGQACLLIVGKKGYDHLRRTDAKIEGKYIDFYNNLSFQDAAKITNTLVKNFENKKFDRVFIIYNEFESIIQQGITVKQFLPVIPKKHDKRPVTIVYEPHPDKVLNHLAPTCLQYQFYCMLLESYTAEQSARMTAMETAADNADEMIKRLILFYNKARQAAITTELTEIVSGVEALKG